MLLWRKVTSNYERLPTAGGLFSVPDYEHVIQIFFDGRSRMTTKSAKPVLSQEHFPYGNLDFLRSHPRFSPDAMRYQTFEAAYCAGKDKLPCDKEGYGGILNQSEKSVDVIAHLVRSVVQRYFLLKRYEYI